MRNAIEDLPAIQHAKIRQHKASAGGSKRPV
jgi:hypothetical protein